MKFLPLIAGKTIIKLGKVMGGRGSAAPGSMALKLNKRLPSKFTLPQKIIMVTGTNGKTSVTKFIHEMFEKSGFKSITNDTGANMFIGIVTTLIKNSDMHMHVNGDVLVLEVDELHLKRACEDIPPTDLVITNLFDDQVDRLGGPDNLAKRMAKFIPSDTTLYLNGNDPYVTQISELTGNKTIFFGVDPECMAESKSDKHIKCPKCQKNLDYNGIVYDHLGKYSCSCGFKSPNLDYAIKKIDGRNFTLNEMDFQSPISPIYAIYNSSASLSVCIQAGLNQEKLSSILSSIDVGNGRLERFKFNGKDAFVNLVKNPVGFNLTLNLIKEESCENPYNIFIGTNNEEADGVDTSWYYSIDFPVLKDNIPKNVFVDGKSSAVMADAIKSALPNVNISQCSVSEIVPTLIHETDIPCYFLSNFTMLKSTISALSKNNIIA